MPTVTADVEIDFTALQAAVQYVTEKYGAVTLVDRITNHPDGSVRLHVRCFETPDGVPAPIQVNVWGSIRGEAGE